VFPSLLSSHFFGGGARYKEWNREREYTFEVAKIKTQLALEDSFLSIARAAEGSSLIICDRGVMDSKAYSQPELWQEILRKEGWSEVRLRDKYVGSSVCL
jgi:hypothetical protein